MKYIVEIPEGAELPKTGYLRNAKPLGTCKTCQLNRICVGPGPYDDEDFNSAEYSYCSEYKGEKK